MTEPVDLSKFRNARKFGQGEEVSNHTFSGPAICPACHHKWDQEAVEAPAWHQLVCPSCQSHRGVFFHPISLPENALVYTCLWCDGQVYQITTAGTFCIGCGAYHTFS